MVEDGAGDRAGLQLGDILVGYAGKPVPGTAEFTEALGAAPQGEPIRIDFLRMTADGRFERGSVTVPGGPIGAGLMPI